MNTRKVGSGERQESIHGGCRQQRLSVEQMCLPTPCPLSHVFFFFFPNKPFCDSISAPEASVSAPGRPRGHLAMALLSWAAGDQWGGSLQPHHAHSHLQPLSVSPGETLKGRGPWQWGRGLQSLLQRGIERLLEKKLL